MLNKPDWYAFEDGRTLGTRGTENGIIVQDEEHSDGARVTLERDGYTPYAITCGVYGLMFHTCFFGEPAEAQAGFEAIKKALSQILQLTPYGVDPEVDAKRNREIEKFIKAFP